MIVGTTKNGVVRPISRLFAADRSRNPAGGRLFGQAPSVRSGSSMTPVRMDAPQTAGVLKIRRAIVVASHFPVRRPCGHAAGRA